MLRTMGYGIRLVRSVFAGSIECARVRRWRVVVGLLAMVVLAGGAFVVPATRVWAEAPDTGALEGLSARAVHAVNLLAAMERQYDRDVAPLARVLRSYRDDAPLARRIAFALVREGRSTGVDPRLLMAVLLVENPDLKPHAVSSVGARGLMQVMPVHRGTFKECGRNLFGVESNICYGARLFAQYLERSAGDVDRALLRYNGCVHGTNTPNCHAYPQYVYARAGRASLLAWRQLRQNGGAASP